MGGPYHGTIVGVEFSIGARHVTTRDPGVNPLGSGIDFGVVQTWRNVINAVDDRKIIGVATKFPFVVSECARKLPLYHVFRISQNPEL